RPVGSPPTGMVRVRPPAPTTVTPSVPPVTQRRWPAVVRWVTGPGVGTTASTRPRAGLIRDTVLVSGSATHTPPSPAATTPAVRPMLMAGPGRPVAAVRRPAGYR